MKAHAFYTVSGPRGACREEGSDYLSGPRCDITQRSVPHGHVETIIAMLTSSSSFAVIGHRTLELYYFIIFIVLYIFLFNSRTRNKN